MMNVDEQLSVEVPTHLFRFEERVFGMTISQLMFDAVAGAAIWSLWNAGFPLKERIALCVGAALLTIAFVHVKIRTRSLVEWGSLYVLFWLTPAKTVWYNSAVPTVLEAKKQKSDSRPSVQATWINLDSIENGYLVFRDDKSKKRKQAPPNRYSAVLEVTGVNLQLLSMQSRLRIFQAYETFLAGLEFPLQIITCNETVDVQSYEPLLALEEQIKLLQSTPRLATLARNQVQFVRQKMGTNIVTRHYVVVTASPLEEEVKRVDGKPKAGLTAVLEFFGWKKKPVFSSDETIRQLRIRLKVVHDGFKEMGLQVGLLKEVELMHAYASFLAPGTRMTRGEWDEENLRSMLLVPFPEAEDAPAAQPQAQQGEQSEVLKKEDLKEKEVAV